MCKHPLWKISSMSSTGGVWFSKRLACWVSHLKFTLHLCNILVKIYHRRVSNYPQNYRSEGICLAVPVSKFFLLFYYLESEANITLLHRSLSLLSSVASEPLHINGKFAIPLHNPNLWSDGGSIHYLLEVFSWPIQHNLCNKLSSKLSTRGSVVLIMSYTPIKKKKKKE